MKQQGTIIAVVGPSGAGKDTLIEFARDAFESDERVGVVQRTITRSANAGGEAHEAISEADFEEKKELGAFTLWWRAHGLSYGIPASTLADITEGRVLIVNGSRSALPAFRDTYGEALKIALITAPKAVLAARLSSRGRESAQSILKRLERKDYEENLGKIDITIINDQAPEDAGRILVDFIKGIVTSEQDGRHGAQGLAEDTFPFPGLIRH